MRVAIVPGHSERSQGAVNRQGLSEYRQGVVLGRQVVQLLARKDHHSCLFHRSNLQYTKAMQSLTARLNDWAPDCIISLHFNSSADKAAHGCEALYWPSSAAGLDLAAAVAGRIAVAAGLRGRGRSGATPQSRSYAGAPLYILRSTKAPAIILESHFGSNPRDTLAFQRAVDSGDAARAIADGVIFWGSEYAKR